MRMVRVSGFLWGKESRLSGTNILQDVRRQNVKIWGTRARGKGLICGGR